MGIVIRPATAGDQASIIELIRQARINQRDLDWRRFMVAEEEGRVVGVGQVRVYPGGARELASGVVLPEYRGQGVGGRLVEALLAREAGPLYLLLDEPHAESYAGLGFRRLAPAELPASLRAAYRRGRLITALVSITLWRRIRIVPLRRDGPERSGGKP
jgi:amino-acid N-acetyltransferase